MNNDGKQTVYIKLIGQSGSGKSTLRQLIGEMLNNAGVEWALRLDSGEDVPGDAIPHHDAYAAENLAESKVVIREVGISSAQERTGFVWNS